MVFGNNNSNSKKRKSNEDHYSDESDSCSICNNKRTQKSKEYSVIVQQNSDNSNVIIKSSKPRYNICDRLTELARPKPINLLKTLEEHLHHLNTFQIENFLNNIFSSTYKTPENALKYYRECMSRRKLRRNTIKKKKPTELSKVEEILRRLVKQFKFYFLGTKSQVLSKDLSDLSNILMSDLVSSLGISYPSRNSKKTLDSFLYNLTDKTSTWMIKLLQASQLVKNSNRQSIFDLMSGRTESNKKTYPKKYGKDHEIYGSLDHKNIKIPPKDSSVIIVNMAIIEGSKGGQSSNQNSHTQNQAQSETQYLEFDEMTEDITIDSDILDDFENLASGTSEINNQRQIPAQSQHPTQIHLPAQIPAQNQIPAKSQVPAQSQVSPQNQISAQSRMIVQSQIPVQNQIPAQSQVPAKSQVLPRDQIPAQNQTQSQTQNPRTKAQFTHGYLTQENIGVQANQTVNTQNQNDQTIENFCSDPEVVTEIENLKQKISEINAKLQNCCNVANCQGAPKPSGNGLVVNMTDNSESLRSETSDNQFPVIARKTLAKPQSYNPQIFMAPIHVDVQAQSNDQDQNETITGLYDTLTDVTINFSKLLDDYKEAGVLKLTGIYDDLKNLTEEFDKIVRNSENLVRNLETSIQMSQAVAVKKTIPGDQVKTAIRNAQEQLETQKSDVMKSQRKTNLGAKPKNFIKKTSAVQKKKQVRVEVPQVYSFSEITNDSNLNLNVTEDFEELIENEPLQDTPAFSNYGFEEIHVGTLNPVDVKKIREQYMSVKNYRKSKGSGVVPISVRSKDTNNVLGVRKLSVRDLVKMHDSKHSGSSIKIAVSELETPSQNKILSMKKIPVNELKKFFEKNTNDLQNYTKSFQEISNSTIRRQKTYAVKHAKSSGPEIVVKVNDQEVDLDNDDFMTAYVIKRNDPTYDDRFLKPPRNH